VLDSRAHFLEKRGIFFRKKNTLFKEKVKNVCEPRAHPPVKWARRSRTRGVRVHARRLFHGPGNVHGCHGSMRVICDSSVGIDSANVYGKGAYFGLSGVPNSAPGTETHSVFLVNVLLGESCVTMYVPPTKPPPATSRFETTTDQALVTHVVPLAPLEALVPAAPAPAAATSQSSVAVGSLLLGAPRV
jgi:hypothetical protein